MTISRSTLQTSAHRAAAALLAAVLAGALAAGAGCASSQGSRSGWFEPYRTDLPQGNYLTQEMVDQIKVGMTREQVRFALGSPLLTPVFRTDRWDYVFRYQRANGSSELRRVTVTFKDDRVVDLRADDTLPASAEASDPALPGYRPQARPEAAK